MLKAKMIRTLFIAFSCLCIFAPFKQGFAQNCDTVFEMIVELREPPLGAYNLWDLQYGKIEQKEVFKGAARTISARNMVAVAETYKTAGSAKNLALVEIDQRGREVWQSSHDIRGLETIKDMLASDNRYIVLATTKARQKGEQVWIGFFDEKGALKRKEELSRDKADLEALAMTLSADRKYLVVSALAKPNNMALPPSTILYWMDLKSGKIERQRLLAFGSENSLNAIRPVEYGDGYWGSGFLRAEDGRMAGWILRLDEEGGLVWQRQFSRGLGGRFFDIAEFLDGDYVVAVGEAFAADDTRRRSAWVLLLDANGQDVAWQRYYRENHAMRAQSVLTHQDGQISVLIDAKNSLEEGDKDYVRLLTLNPRGIVLENLSFHNAEGTGVFGMTLGPNLDRVFYGYSDVNFDVEEEDPDNPGEYVTDTVKSRQGWVLSAEAAPEYNDPCRKDFRIIP